MNETIEREKATESKWEAIEWSIHAPTTVVTKDCHTGRNSVICECAGSGQGVDVAIERAALIVRAVNEHEALNAVAIAAGRLLCKRGSTLERECAMNLQSALNALAAIELEAIPRVASSVSPAR